MSARNKTTREEESIQEGRRVQELECQTISSRESIVYKGPTSFWYKMDHEEGTGNIYGGYDDKEYELVTFEFPIRETSGENQTKNIPP